MPQNDQSPVNYASHQPSTQAKEVFALVMICILRLLSLPLAPDLKSAPNVESSVVARVVYAIAISIEPYLIIITASVITYMMVMQLTGRTMSRHILDGMGVLLSIFMLLQFTKINLLLITSVGPADVLLTEVVIFLFFFALVWGWILWRIDAATQPAASTIIKLEAEELPITMFDYYHASIESVIFSARLLSIRGATKHARVLVMSRNIMLLDLYALVIGRFYLLVQKVI